MAEVAVEIPTCKGCGAEVRSESLFCYSCGAALNADAGSVGSANEKEPEPATDAAPVGKRNDEEPEAAVEIRPPLTSAASLRRKRRAFDRQPVRISWEPPDRQPTAFIVAAIALTIGAAILLAIAMYLR